jgi:spore coat protein U-like protein
VRAWDVVAASIVTIATLLILVPQALAVCLISTIGVNFGSYDSSVGSPNDSTGSVTYRCNQNDPITISLNGGTWGNIVQRKMRSASGDVLLYNLYKDAARTVVWGDAGSQLYSDPNPPGRGAGNAVTVPIYARIFSLQDVGVGTYSDSITVTINW